MTRFFGTAGSVALGPYRTVHSGSEWVRRGPPGASSGFADTAQEVLVDLQVRFLLGRGGDGRVVRLLDRRRDQTGLVIRVRASSRGSRIDMRSLSRQGRSDFGVNAARIEKFMAALKSRID